MKRAPKLDDKVKEKLPERVMESLSKNNADLAKLVNESLETEQLLARQERGNRSKTLEKLKFVKSIKAKLRSSENRNKDLKEEIKKLSRYYAEEIHGHFNKWLFSFLQWISPIVLNFLLNSFSLIQFFKNFRGTSELKNKIIVHGNVELVKRLEKFGALVIVPTHVSNFDSIVLALMMHRAELNPPIWGAGLNLFKGFTISRIMNNMGCYKIDRRKKNRIYIETLKQYSTYHLEQGCNTIFYPGGTRSRSGEIEQKLKLGLISTVVSAFVNNIKSGKIKSNIYVVPITISYTVVPEAETLALDHFFGEDKRKQILKRISAKATLLGRTLKKVWNNLMQDNPIHVNFGDPMDPFGNNVNYEGVSVDKYGIPINVVDSTKDKDGNPIVDEDLNRHYTKILSEKISEDFYRTNMVLPSQLFLFSIVSYLKEEHPGKTDDEMVMLPPMDNTINNTALKEEISDVVKIVKGKAETDGLKLHPWIEREDVERIFRYGVRIYTSGYAARPIIKKGDSIIPNKIATIFYYSS
ncbi:MAG: 1-acyl-sn-glycerol-3-phosphate acyltransferase, partial [Pseudomonadota bacterium]